MSKLDRDFDQFVQLLSAMEEGELSDSQKLELADWLNDSQQARAAYYDYIMMQTLLRRKAARVEGSATLFAEIEEDEDQLLEALDFEAKSIQYDIESREVSGENNNSSSSEADSPTLGFLGSISKLGNQLTSNPMAFSISISLLTISALILVLAFVNPFGDDKDLAEKNIDIKPQVVALITYESDCTWAKGSVDKIAGKSLLSGDEIELNSGVAEIMFTSGVKVILKGPSILGLVSDNSSRLTSGSLTATVPKKASGFTVHTPYAQVVDLGTRFGVTADAKKGAYVFVKDGKVEVGYSSPGSSSRQVKPLTAGQAFQVLPSGDTKESKPGKADSDTFVFTVIKTDEPSSYSQAVLGDRPLAYWRLNEKSGTVAKDSSGNNHHAKYTGGVKLGLSGPLRNSRNTAALFDGKTGYVALPVLGKAKQLTMEAWVQVDHFQSNMILIATNKSTGSPDGSLHWQFNSNAQMVMEAKKSGWRTSTFTSSFLNNRWYHVVLTYDPSQQETTLYVNGKLAEKKTKLTIVPANLGKSLIGGGYHRGLYLSGKIAEVALYRKVLTPKQIAKHYHASKITKGNK